MLRIHQAACRVLRNQKTTAACMHISYPVNLVHILTTSQGPGGHRTGGGLSQS